MMPSARVLWIMAVMLFVCWQAGDVYGRPKRPDRLPAGGNYQKPVNNPRPGASDPVYAHGLFIFGGKVTVVNLKEITVEGKDAQGRARTMRFRITEKSSCPKNIERGARVVIQYTTTMDSGVYEVVRCLKLPAGKKFPRPTFPSH